ncbi:MAG: hypothetical protein AAB863_03750, partial [Patescibacteria group bacterium]
NLALQPWGGNVGIGTTTPSNILSVGARNPTTATDRKAIEINAGGFASPAAYNTVSNGDKLILYRDAAASYDSTIGVGTVGDMWFKSSGPTAADGQFVWYTGDTPNERMRITAAGNVGIGTTTPWGLLSVNGNALAAGVPQLVVGSSTKTDFIVDEAGNVGIGTTGPIDKLQVNGSVVGGNTGMGLLITNTNAAVGDISHIILGASNDATSLYQKAGIFFKQTNVTNGTGELHFANAAGVTSANVDITDSKMVILNNGNVGIGTTTPRAMLGIMSASSTPGLMIQTVGNTGEGTVAISLDANAICVDGSADGACALNDIAELYPSNEILLAGEIVSLSLINPLYIKKAETGEDLMGVISTSPAIVMEGSSVKHMGGVYTPQNGKYPVALAGRVPVKVNLEDGDIAIGDRIGLSSVAGVGSRAVASGAVIGVALQPFTAASTGNTILVLVGNEKYIPDSMFTIDGNGNVGIGSTTPMYKLAVMGDVAAT